MNPLRAALFEPRRIALVGASSDPSRLTARAQLYLRKHGFTGEILPVFYVSDSRVSENFYRRLGFEVTYYHDYETGQALTVWTKAEPPIYIEMKAGELRFAIHLITEGDLLAVDGMKHYFGVRDVDVHHRNVIENGIPAGEIYDRPWMRMFTVTDPDGHALYFFTRPETWRR